MTYRNRVTRCRHGFAIGIVRCEACNMQTLRAKDAMKGIKPRVGREGLRETRGSVPSSYRASRGGV